MFIDGAFAESSGGTFDNINPATEEVLGVAADGATEDMKNAVAAARRAFDRTEWSTDHALRRRCLDQLQQAMEDAKEEFREIIVAEGGSPIALTYVVQVDDTIANFRHFAELADTYRYERDGGSFPSSGLPSTATILKEPIGVVAAITPFNFPLFLTLNKVGPALAAGCTVVHKPAPETPWTGTLLARCVAETDIPPGVFNVVTTSSDDVSESLVADPGVDMVTFTGSTATGKRILSVTADQVKRVHLELGGKSASILLDDADLPMAVTFLSSMACAHSGQACARHTRMLLPRSRYDEGVELATGIFSALAAGDPTDVNFLHGPQITARQRDLVLSQLERAEAEGAKIAARGTKPDGPGYWIEPTLLVNVDPGTTAATDEIFGPVLAVMPYEDDDDAVRIANDSAYGLAGGVWSADTARAEAIARRIRAGSISINTSMFIHPTWPFGGYKQSGLGREGGSEGFEEFLETKTITSPST